MRSLVGKYGVLQRWNRRAQVWVSVRPPEGATSRYPFVTSEWARRWPSEEIWKARKKR